MLSKNSQRVTRIGSPETSSLDIPTPNFSSKASEKTCTSLPFSSLSAARVFNLRAGNTSLPAGTKNCKTYLGGVPLARGALGRILRVLPTMLHCNRLQAYRKCSRKDNLFCEDIGYRRCRLYRRDCRGTSCRNGTPGPGFRQFVPRPARSAPARRRLCPRRTR